MAFVLTFLLWVGVLAGLYAQTEARIARLDGIQEITVYTVTKGDSSSWLARLDRDAFRQPPYDELLACLSAAQPTGPQAYPQHRAGFLLELSLPAAGTFPPTWTQQRGPWCFLAAAVTSFPPRPSLF